MAEPQDEPERDDYDSPWKEAMERYFPEFMAFFFPKAHAQIDWSEEFVFLDQELREVVQDAELGKRILDKLVRVSLRDGGEGWVYIHVEVQGSRQGEFPERLFVYNYRLYDRYRRPVASLAVLADEESGWRPDRFGYELFDCTMGLHFPVAKLLDYEAQLEGLLEQPNAFALVTAAHLLTKRTRNDAGGRFEAKRRLVRLLYQRGWERQKIIDLLAVIDWLMRLPEALDRQLWNEIMTIEESEHMRYVTSIERMAMQKGRDEGRNEGRDQGRIEGEAKLLARLLERRFGPLPDAARERLSAAGEAQLEAWGDAVLTASSLEAVFEGETH